MTEDIENTVEDDELDALEHFINTARLLSREMNTILDEDGLREESWRAMRLLAKGPGLLMGEIAESLTVSNATVTRLINSLVDSGLVYRRPGDDDGRKAVAHLSRLGRERLRRADSLLTARLRIPERRPHREHTHSARTRPSAS